MKSTVEVTPENDRSLFSRRYARSYASNENDSINNPPDKCVSSRLRKRKSPMPCNENEEACGDDSESDAKEIGGKEKKSSPYPLGIVIEKEFGEGCFKGEVVAGPSLVGGEAVWHVIYSDGDDEQMTLKEIEEYKVAGGGDGPRVITAPDFIASLASFYKYAGDSADTTISAVNPRSAISPDQKPQGDKKSATNPYSVYQEDYETAFSDLKWRMGTTEEEARLALDGMEPPYGLNEAMRRIHKSKESPNSYVPRKKFVPKAGMRVRKFYDGAIWYGTLKSSQPQWCRDDISGKDVKMWEVNFDDGITEDMDFNELRTSYAGRPTRTHPIRGRPLYALELFCGQGIISQEFAELKWIVRSIDIDPKSYATDVIDVMKLRYHDVGFLPDYVHASPSCHTNSLLAGGKHRSNEPGQYEKTEEARKQNRILAQMFAILRYFKKKKPHMVITIENPVGLLQHLPIMKEMERTLGLTKVQVHYCAFGRDDKKPTYIWTSSWKLRANLADFKCGENCPYFGGIHPVGVRGYGRDYNAAAIPQPLAEEIANCVHSSFYDQRIRHTKDTKLSKDEVESFDSLMAC